THKCPNTFLMYESLCCTYYKQKDYCISFCFGEGYKAERWLLHSLQGHILSAQLKPLLQHKTNTQKYYNDGAFLLSEPHVSAMLQCLEAVEQNNPRLLALLDTLSHLKESPFGLLKSQSLCLLPGATGSWKPADNSESRRLATSQSCLTESPNTPQSKSSSGQQVSENNRPLCGSITTLNACLVYTQNVDSTETFLKNGIKVFQNNTKVYISKKISFSSSWTLTNLIKSYSNNHLLKRVFMLTDSSQHNSVPDGLFRRPSEGQSLISYLSEQDFGSCADLEKENAHFSISESLIAAIELMKCNMRRPLEEAEEEGDSDSEIQQLKQKIRLRRLQIRHTRMKPPASSITSVDSGGSRRSSQDSFHPSDSGSDRDVEDIELKDADIKRSASSSRSFLSSDSISPSMLQSNSAESVAMGLLRQFEGMQLPAASELDWLVPEHDAPQKLLPIPDSLPISPDDGEHADIYKLRIRVRGNLEWAPPRPQIIFNIHSPPKRKVVVAKQNYRCAGCGIRVDPDYIKRLRYCEYLGRYFCQCCHENTQAVVPGKILRKWDFSKSYISNFSRDLLAKIEGDPLFNLNDINSGLYKKVKALETVRALREQLNHMKNLLKTCRLAKEVRDQFDTLPGHLTEDFHLFSLNDLTAVRSGSLAPKLRDLLRLGSRHVTDCVLCQAKGFICEFCGNDKDIIFPYELSKCLRCEDCHACYHKTCFKGGKQCPRCLRLAERRKRMACKNMEEQEDREADEASLIREM
uniref:Rubicon autophagy regulator n=1 Tax=Cyprinus carpio carpio TaxID=630221 RepID=A0A9J8B3K4_CYPCA